VGYVSMSSDQMQYTFFWHGTSVFCVQRVPCSIKRSLQRRHTELNFTLQWLIHSPTQKSLVNNLVTNVGERGGHNNNCKTHTYARFLLTQGTNTINLICINLWDLVKFMLKILIYIADIIVLPGQLHEFSGHACQEKSNIFFDVQSFWGC